MPHSKLGRQCVYDISEIRLVHPDPSYALVVLRPGCTRLAGRLGSRAERGQACEPDQWLTQTGPGKALSVTSPSKRYASSSFC